jgi:hypothetical protein
MRLSTRKQVALVFIPLLGVATLICLGFWGFSYDDAFITYRYAKNWLDHGILSYNLENITYGTTAPGYALLLGILGFLTKYIGISIPEWGTIVSIISILTVTAVIHLSISKKALLFRVSVPLLFGIIALILRWNIEVLGSETFPVLALVIVSSFLLFKKKRLVMAGLFIFFAIFLRLDAGLAALSISIVYWVGQKKFPWRFALSGILPLIPWLSFLLVHFRHIIPDTLTVKQFEQTLTHLGWNFTIWSWLQRTLHLAGSVAFIGFSGLGLVLGIRNFFHKDAMTYALILWIISHETLYWMLNVPFAPWYHLVLICCMTALLAYGIIMVCRILNNFRLKGGFRNLRTPAVVILAMLFLSPLILPSVKFVLNQWKRPPDPRFRIYSQIGAYIANEALPEERVAAVEIGFLGYTSEISVLDLMGLVTPDAHAAKISGKLDEYVAEKAPRYIVYNPVFNTSVFKEKLAYNEIRKTYQRVKKFQTEEYEARAVILLERSDQR